jgi:hypothetical protein
LDAGSPPEMSATAIDESQRLMHLATSEQQPRLVGYVHAELANIPQAILKRFYFIIEIQMSSLERLSIMDTDEPIFIEEGEEEEPLFEIDLGAFELVDTGISAEANYLEIHFI